MFTKFAKYFLLSIPFASIAFASIAFAEKKATFCVDNNYWFPYVMTDEKTGEVSGALIDITEEILKKMNIKGEYKSTPWSRCTSKDNTSNGEFDGIITPSYKKSRTEFIDYPKTAEKESQKCSSPENIVCAKYVFVAPKDSTYVYEGDVNTLPQPIRAPRGYSVVADIDEVLKKSQKSVEVGTSDEKNLQKMIRDEKGVAILADAVAKHLLSKSEYKDKLKIIEKPYEEKSNYLAFYKASKNFTDTDKKEFWKILVEFNKDKKFIDKIYSKYQR